MTGAVAHRQGEDCGGKIEDSSGRPIRKSSLFSMYIKIIPRTLAGHTSTRITNNLSSSCPRYSPQRQHIKTVL